jgi:hypothetical protein
MRRLLQCLAGAVLLTLPVVNSSATALSNLEIRTLKRHQKGERKKLEQQQRAMKKVMAQHEQSSESRKRFEHNLKMQRQFLRKNQKDEVRRLKENHNRQKSPPPSS